MEQLWYDIDGEVASLSMIEIIEPFDATEFMQTQIHLHLKSKCIFGGTLFKVRSIFRCTFFKVWR